MWPLLQRLFFGSRFTQRYDVGKKLTLWALANGSGAAVSLRNGGDTEFQKLSAIELMTLRSSITTILDQIEKAKP